MSDASTCLRYETANLSKTLHANLWALSRRRFAGSPGSAEQVAPSKQYMFRPSVFVLPGLAHGRPQPQQLQRTGLAGRAAPPRARAVARLRLRRAPPGDAALLLRRRPPRARPRGPRTPVGAAGGRRASRAQRRRARRGGRGRSIWRSSRQLRGVLIGRARRGGRCASVPPWRVAPEALIGRAAGGCRRGCRLGGWQRLCGCGVCRDVLGRARRAWQRRRRLSCAGKRGPRGACTPTLTSCAAAAATWA